MAADGITVSRMLFSLLLFAFPAFSPAFTALYLLCGVTDVLDGFIARKLHTASKAGERLDSIADLFFAFVYAVRILPLLCLPVWIRVWTVFIAAVKISGILKNSRRERRLCVAHSFANKLTGLLLFLLPLTIHRIDIRYGAAVVCAAATYAAAEEFFQAERSKK